MQGGGRALEITIKFGVSLSENSKTGYTFENATEMNY